MATSGRLKNLVAGRALTTFVVICTLLAITTAPVFAGYDWCSKDPVFTFKPVGGILPEHVIDVQVWVQGQGMISDDTATLTVAYPSNRVVEEVLDLSTAFNLDVTFKPVLAPAATSAYTVKLATLFPDTHGALPVRLVVSAPDGALSVSCEGVAGKSVRAVVQFEPFSVSCQQDTVSLTSAVTN